MIQLNDFVGNIEVISELRASMAQSSLPHAILIDGTKGTGKRTLAGIIAQYCVCRSDIRPCGICPGCIKTSKGIHPDITVLDGERSGELSISSIRRLRSDAYIKPNESDSRIFLLLNCDKMLAPAQNAFLKILEEPPANVYFAITVSSSNMLLETVRSRCRRLTLYPVTTEQAAKTVQARFPDKDMYQIMQYAAICDGNIGQTIELIENGGEEAMKEAKKIFSLIGMSTEYEQLAAINSICRDRAFVSSVLDCLLELSSECLKASVGADFRYPEVRTVSERLGQRKTLLLSDTLRNAKAVLKTNVNLNFFGTWLSSSLRV